MVNHIQSINFIEALQLKKKGCKDRCSCKVFGLKCTEVCFCNGQCWKHCCVLESAVCKFNFLITVTDIVKHQLTKTCSKLAILLLIEKLGNFNDVIFERPHFLELLLLMLNTSKIITLKNPVATFGSYICDKGHMNA